jgi:DNA gyrase inhibitor GyrI
MTVDDPHVTPKRLYRYEVCLASSLPFECMEGMSKLKMPAMRYAVIKVSGDIHKVATAWDYLIQRLAYQQCLRARACAST